MDKESLLNFQGRSRDTIEQSIEERSYKSTIDRLNRRTESGKIVIAEKIARMFRMRGKNEQVARERHLTAMEKSKEITREMVALIERYAGMNPR